MVLKLRLSVIFRLMNRPRFRMSVRKVIIRLVVRVVLLRLRPLTGIVFRPLRILSLYVVRKRRPIVVMVSLVRPFFNRLKFRTVKRLCRLVKLMVILLIIIWIWVNQKIRRIRLLRLSKLTLIRVRFLMAMAIALVRRLTLVILRLWIVRRRLPLRMRLYAIWMSRLLLMLNVFVVRFCRLRNTVAVYRRGKLVICRLRKKRSSLAFRLSVKRVGILLLRSVGLAPMMVPIVSYVRRRLLVRRNLWSRNRLRFL